MTTHSAQIIAHPATVAQATKESTVRPLTRERAVCLRYGTFEAAEFFIGTQGFELDLSTYRCGLCEGKFPSVGRAMFFLDQHGTFVPIHKGCYRDVDAWATSDDEVPA